MLLHVDICIQVLKISRVTGNTVFTFECTEKGNGLITLFLVAKERCHVNAGEYRTFLLNFSSVLES